MSTFLPMTATATERHHRKVKKELEEQRMARINEALRTVYQKQGSHFVDPTGQRSESAKAMAPTPKTNCRIEAALQNFSSLLTTQAYAQCKQTDWSKQVLTAKTITEVTLPKRRVMLEVDYAD